MDRTTLVNSIRDSFIKKRKDGLFIDAISLSSAYDGMIRDSYILSVSAPSLIGKECGEMVTEIIKAMFEYLPEEERGMIDRVRVYTSIEELQRNKNKDFTELDCDCESNPIRIKPEFYEMA